MAGKSRSFDIFDTLIARRCVEAQNIFLEVASQAEDPRFPRARASAEARLAGGDYGLDDIYRALRSDLGLTEERSEELKRLEIAAELENSIPIAENLSRVRDGDYLVSDMYLPEPVIRRMLDGAGLRRSVTILLSANGKSSGRVFREPVFRDAIESHEGDNLESDVNIPLSLGIRAVHNRTHALHPVEKLLRKYGLERLCRVVREIRLGQLPAGPEMRPIFEAQMLFNLPLLVLASAAIRRHCAQRGLSYVNFCSRDCVHLKRVFDLLFPHGAGIRTNYFYTSRLCRIRASESYLDYCRAHFLPGSVLVDLCGTGWSLSYLLGRLGVGSEIFLLHRIPKDSSMAATYRAICPVDTPAGITAVMEGTCFRNDMWEQLNYASHGMVTGVRADGSATGFVPEFGEPGYPPRVAESVAFAGALVGRLASVLERNDTGALLDEISRNFETVPIVMRLLYQSFPVTCAPAMTGVFTAYHQEEDLGVMADLARAAVR